MHTLFEPALVNDSFGDPGLLVDFRDERRALLIDLGDITALPPRKLMRVSNAFVTHTHMDHFAGFDHWLRVVLGRKARVAFHGGPGFIAQVEHKLRAYTWNVVHRYEVELVIEAFELAVDGSISRAQFSSRNRFERQSLAAPQAREDTVHEEAMFRVRARFVDHDIPCLSYAIEEKAHVNVRKERLVQTGFAAGSWLRELKHAILTNAPGDTVIELNWKDRDGAHEARRTVDELRELILDVVAGRRVGYVTDLRYTDANVATLQALLRDVDLLFIECVFLDEDADHAARKNHLTAGQAGRVARAVGARTVVPFHFSPRYQGREAELVAQMNRAWSGAQLSV
ncbi:MAG TPA: MBL fold metallo-hydrolase [Casimicrobiaceae bacterium]|nr:MBL fold metallo-hydrolase [Casimicrobiaceae bacterium]